MNFEGEDFIEWLKWNLFILLNFIEKGLRGYLEDTLDNAQSYQDIDAHSRQRRGNEGQQSRGRDAETKNSLSTDSCGEPSA